MHFHYLFPLKEEFTFAEMIRFSPSLRLDVHRGDAFIREGWGWHALVHRGSRGRISVRQEHRVPVRLCLPTLDVFVGRALGT